MNCNKIEVKGRLRMKDKLITQITSNMAKSLSVKQLEDLKKVLTAAFTRIEIAEVKSATEQETNSHLLELFISAKRIEGCSEKSLKYYNRLYAQRSVTVPVFGSGITRFKNGFEDIDINELLRIMIWTFKISKIKFAYPAKLTIIVHDDLLNQVNLYELRENE